MNDYRDELYHHGIKGQKWGVRRYRNPDGSLTEAGKKRLKRKEDRLNSENRYEKTARQLFEYRKANAYITGGAEAYSKYVNSYQAFELWSNAEHAKKEYRK